MLPQFSPVPPPGTLLLDASSLQEYGAYKPFAAEKFVEKPLTTKNEVPEHVTAGGGLGGGGEGGGEGGGGGPVHITVTCEADRPAKFVLYV